MRVVNNIYNEYRVYYEEINKNNTKSNNTHELNCDKLLAIVIYKNIFPQDFAKLHQRKGVLYALFQQKGLLQNELIKNTKEEIERLKQELANTQIQLKYEESAIKAFYSLLKDSPLQRSVTNAYYDRDYENFKGELDFFKNFDKAQLVGYKTTIINDTTQELIERINKCENKLYETSKMETHELLMLDVGEKFFRLEYSTSNIELNSIDLHDYPLLQYLILSGNIDSTYSDYMNYFYPNSISYEDKLFLRSLAENRAKEFSYQLKDVQLITSKLQDNYFDRAAILNFDLLEYFLFKSLKKDYLKIYELLITHENFDFIFEFADANKERGKFIHSLLIAHPELLDFIRNHSKVSDWNCHKFTFLAIEYYKRQRKSEPSAHEILSHLCA